MGKLYLDIGNTFIKLAKKSEVGWELLNHIRLETAESLLEDVTKNHSFDKVIVSSVRSDILDWIEKIFSDKEVLSITGSIVPPYYLDYDTPKTLGVDRFLVCLGASDKTPNNVVVIDAGTACTIDLMTSDKIFRGGVIMPGIKVIHESIVKTLPELPEVDKYLPEKWPGKSTESSLQWGINGSYMMSIISFIDKYREGFDHIDIFLTGGDAGYIIEILQDKLAVKHRPNLIFDGMAVFESL